MKYRFSYIIALLSLFSIRCFAYNSSDTREITPLKTWQFTQDTSEENSDIVLPKKGTQWTTVKSPHCFRLSGLPEKSAGFYHQTLNPKKSDKGHRFYVFLEGAGSIVDVYVNGTHIGQHKGAYTACWFDVTPALNFGKQNDLVLRITNRDKECINCLSQSNLFYTNGGLYRPAWLIKTSGIHIFPDTGSYGVYLTPKNISKDKADLEIKTYVKNPYNKEAKIVVRSSITNPNGKSIGTVKKEVTLPAETIQAITTQKTISHPVFWSVHQGNLYTVKTELLVNGKIIDEINEDTGIRTIVMENEDFVLNGEKVLVRGVSKHHMDEHVWNAMSNKQLKWEMDGMVNLGVNTIRLAHYPHSRFEYDLTDKNGLLVWAENGLAGHRWDHGERAKRESKPTPVGEQITREMVRQNWNHPSIVFWSSGNETHDKTAHYYADVIRQEDTSRLITYASAGEKPDNVDFVAGNTYQGWYWGAYTDFSELPTNEYVSETGAGAWTTHHVPYGTIKWDVDKYEPEEYAQLFSEFRFQTIFKNNPDGHKMYLWWNYREFYNKKFKGNRNTKGLITLAGKPKDHYYLFQSFLRQNYPVLHICDSDFFFRQFDPSNGIKVYSNANDVELFVNGKSQGVLNNGDYTLPGSKDIIPPNGDTVQRNDEGIIVDNVFFWKATLKPGKNIIEALDDQGKKDSMVIYQKGENMPLPKDSLVVDLRSSNPVNPAIFIDRPIEAQGPFYYDVDGSSDNTFDELPEELKGAKWIATKRLSDAYNATDLTFKLSHAANIYVMHSTGIHPAHTLHAPNMAVVGESAALEKDLKKAGFVDAGLNGIWRGHDLWLANSNTMKLKAKAGDKITIPAHTLDYVILVKPE